MLLALQLNNLLEEAGASPPVLLGNIPALSSTFNTGTHQFNLSVYFSGADTYAIDPAVETGWSFDTNTGVLEIDTDDEDIFGPYIVTATNTDGDTDSNAFNVRVSAFIKTGVIAGTAVDSAGVMGANFLDDVTAVPAGAYFLGGFAHDTDGLRYVAAWPGSGVVVRIRGIALRPDGAMTIAAGGSIAAFSGTWALTSRGEVVASTSQPQIVNGGFGQLTDGTVCMSEVA